MDDEADDDLLEETAEALLEDDTVYEAQATDLMSAEQLKERHKEEIKNTLEDGELQEAIERGFNLIREDIIEVLAEEELEPFFNDLSKINQNALDTPSDKVQEKLNADDGTLTFQEIFDLSNETLRQIYSLGYQYYQKKDYDNAIDIFSIVTTFNPFISDFWNSLALCYQAKQDLTKAMDAFAVACMTNEENVGPRVSRAECCMSLKQGQEAEQELEIASKIIEKNPALDEKWGNYLKELKEQV